MKMPAMPMLTVRSPKHFFGWMVALSVGLHIVGSRIPWSQLGQASSELSLEQEDGLSLSVIESINESVETESSDADSAAIALVQLPSSAISNKTTQQNSSAASQQALVTTESALATPEPLLAAPETNVEFLPAEVTPSVQPDPLESVENFVESESLEAETAAPEDMQSASNQEDPAAAPSKEATEETQSQPDFLSDALQSTAGVLVALADFPHLSGSQSGCFGLNQCHQSQGNYREVGEQLTAQMRQQGYQLTQKDDIDGAGHRVFEVVHPDEPDQIYYLNVFSDGLDSAVYALTVDVLSLEELKNLNA